MRRKQRRRLSEAGDKQAAQFSLDIVTGAQNLATLSPQDLFDREQPEDIRATFKLSRNWHKQNWFVEQSNLLKSAFYNYGLRIQPADRKQRKRVKQWLDNPDTVINRLLWWAGPVGFMMLAESVSPCLLQMLKAQALADRRRVGAHLESVINRGFNLGAKIQLSWSNRILNDPRLAWDMMKTMMQHETLLAPQ